MRCIHATENVALCHTRTRRWVEIGVRTPTRQLAADPGAGRATVPTLVESVVCMTARRGTHSLGVITFAEVVILGHPRLRTFVAALIEAIRELCVCRCRRSMESHRIRSHRRVVLSGSEPGTGAVAVQKLGADGLMD